MRSNSDAMMPAEDTATTNTKKSLICTGSRGPNIMHGTTAATTSPLQIYRAARTGEGDVSRGRRTGPSKSVLRSPGAPFCRRLSGCSQNEAPRMTAKPSQNPSQAVMLDSAITSPMVQATMPDPAAEIASGRRWLVSRPLKFCINLYRDGDGNCPTIYRESHGGARRIAVKGEGDVLAFRGKFGGAARDEGKRDVCRTSLFSATHNQTLSDRVEQDSSAQVIKRSHRSECRWRERINVETSREI